VQDHKLLVPLGKEDLQGKYGLNRDEQRGDIEGVEEDLSSNIPVTSGVQGSFCQ
jgi:hypothetical protein